MRAREPSGPVELAAAPLAKIAAFLTEKVWRILKQLPGREESENSWTVKRAEIEEQNYYLKAVNPNRVAEVDTRTSEERLDIIGSCCCFGSGLTQSTLKSFINLDSVSITFSDV